MSIKQESSKVSAKHKEFQSLLDKEFTKVIKEGEIVKGTVTEITQKFVVVDIPGLKMESMLPIDEFSKLEISKLKQNDKCEVYIERIENFKGESVVSRQKAKQLKAWDALVKLHKEDKIADGQVVSRIKGGYIVSISTESGEINTFMPTSQLALSPIKNADRFFNTPLKFKIIKCDMLRGNAISSRRQVLFESKNIETKEIIKELKVGQKIKVVGKFEVSIFG